MKSLPQHSDPAKRSPGDALPPCIDRRAFLGNSTMLAVGALLASACGDGQIGANVTGPDTVGLTVKLSDYAALTTVGGIVKLNGTTTPIAVVRATTVQYRAFSLVCPHEGTTVGVAGSGFLCPNHGAEFTGTGTWKGGQPTSNMREFSVTADLAAGTLSISN